MDGFKLPSNVKELFDVNLDDYYDMLSKAYICLVPLVRNSPSGLLNIIRAAQYRVICLTNDSDFTNIYYPDSCGWMLQRSETEWITNIEKIYSMSSYEYEVEAMKFNEHVIDNFSTSYGTESLQKIIKKLS